jgi:hypothetical protein
MMGHRARRPVFGSQAIEAHKLHLDDIRCRSAGAIVRLIHFVAGINTNTAVVLLFIHLPTIQRV